MINPQRVEEIFQNLDGYLTILRGLGEIPEPELIRDVLKLGAAKYYIQVSVECCIDVANHLIAQQGWRRPESMVDMFSVLVENGVLEPDFLPTLQRMARFRNRLVHLYWEVDALIIFHILHENLRDLERFERNVLEYLGL
jgi:uncharacterized protein YutE (UPF0331/DUF86 family)